MANKVRIRVGDVEVECEGSEPFFREELPSLLKSVLAASGARGPGPERVQRREIDADTDVKVSTSAIASKIKAKTASDLILAAAISLASGSGASTFGREELLKEMKEASAFY
jgi:hypothetical protein